MSASPPVLSLFSYAHGSEAERVAHLRALWADYGATLVDTFLIRFGDTLRERAPSLADALRAFLATGRAIEDPAAFPADLLLACASEQETDPVWAGLAAALHVGGAIEPFRAQLSRPRRIRIRSWVSPPLVSFEQRQGTWLIEREDGVRCELAAYDREGHGDARARAYGFSVCPTIRGRWGEIALMTGDHADTWGFSVNDAWDSTHTEALSVEAMADALRDALELIATHAPQYESWVGSAARIVIPTRHKPEHDTSHSFVAFPGIVVVGLPTDRGMLGELLVHETSHLHHGAVSKGHTLTTSDDPQRYWSPFPQAERNVGMLAFGFHAFANIGLFRRACLAAGLPATGHDFNWQSDWMPEILKVCSQLEQSPGVTLEGRTLWEPVAHQLFGGKRWS
ncbi:MAG TPA: HEXXH motif-containing putative peptide modification protein [Polyangiaceae bacterium]|nr:HEXXH motif-containing putative peptide modification protein [Polyangiaceae bacterium]